MSPTRRVRVHPRAPRSLLLAFGLASLAATALVAPAGAAIDPSAASDHVKRLAVMPDGFASGAVRCPRGKVAISGGAVVHRPGEAPDPSLSVKLVASAPTVDGRGWHGAAASFEDTELRLRLLVVCQSASQVGTVTVRTRDIEPDGTLWARATLGCGTGLRVVTGGATWRPGPGGTAPTGADNLMRSTPTPDGKRWLAQGFTYGDGHRLRIVVLCRPTTSLSQLTVRHRDILSDAGDRDGTVSCGAGRRAVAGGIDWYADGSRSPSTGSIGATTRTDSGKGWYGAASLLAPDIAMRLTVLCLPA